MWLKLGRAPGAQCEKAIPILKQGLWGDIPYNSKAGGCGASVVIFLLEDDEASINELN